MIFQELESVSPKATLCRLALVTCRKFTDPAMSLLWQTQDSIIPLLKCLPSHKWEISNGSFVSRFAYLRIRCHSESEDWHRVLAYSKYIKEYNDRYSVPGELDSSVLGSLTISLSPGLLLINVQHLYCTSESALFPKLEFLVGPHVTEIFFSHPGPFWRFAALPLLVSKCPSLRHFATNGPWDDESREWVSASVMYSAQLRTLDVLTLNGEACRHISGLRNLETLDIGSIPEDPFPRAAPPFSGSPFPALRSLNLRADNHKFAMNFMTALHDTPLQTLSVTVDHSTPTNSVVFLSTIPSYISPDHLTSIVYLQQLDYDKVLANPAMYVMTSNDIRPLLAFHNLTEVTLSSSGGFCLDDEFVDAMALAWSDMEYLSIRGGVSNPTIMALHSLSRHCPRLQHLCLTVDASSVEMDHPAGTPRVVQTALTMWNVQGSPINSSVDVAALLSSIFPSISKTYGSIDRDKWNQVEKLVPVYAAIRAHERGLAQIPTVPT
ncbi:hypothetical protein C8F04DRAFT_1365528 [Mycena alexandri]|uniref:F-box domain-containing protein n=1 Tax=Mycena alexandri TaxID=1745969 RepID=A0AAD6RWJ0_9AGAR|nr:hypothetical protein C8F04DRAFT_1365528 [Mycena alexandri]